MTITEVKEKSLAAMPIRDKLASGNRMLTNHETKTLDTALRAWGEFLATAE